MNLSEFGVEIGFIVSGLFGSILMVSKNAANNLKSSIIAIVGGMASANYLTPTLIHVADIKEAKLQNGLAFVVGFLGLKLVEIVSQKVLDKIQEPTVKPKPKRQVQKKIVKKKAATKRP
jgi:hypothetical protein